MTYQCWAGLTERKRRYHLSLRCVFIKQSSPQASLRLPLPCFPCGQFGAEAYTIPKKAYSFAEFLLEPYSRGRGFLSQVTCFGSRVRLQEIVPGSFFPEDWEGTPVAIRSPLGCLEGVASQRYSPLLCMLNGGVSPREFSLSCQDPGLTLPCLLLQYWDVNQFPFRLPRFAIGLRTDSPFVDNQREGTLDHPSERVFTSLSLLLPLGFTLPPDPSGVTPGLLFWRHARLLRHPFFSGFGVGASYRVSSMMRLFSRPISSRRDVLPTP